MSTPPREKPEHSRDNLIIGLFLAGFVASINVGSLALMRLFLSTLTLILFFVGLRNFQRLLLVQVALLPARSALLTLWSIGGFEWTFGRALMAVSLVCYVRHRSSLRELRPQTNRAMNWLGVLLVLDLASAFLGDGELSPSLKRFLFMLLEVVFFVYLFHRAFVPRDLPRVVSAFSIGCLVMCLSALTERAVSFNFLFRFPTVSAVYAELQEQVIQRADVTRVRSSFQNPVYLSGFLPLVFFASVYLISAGRRTVLGWWLFGAASIVTVMSVSRTAIYGVAMFVGPAAILMLRGDAVRRVLRALILGVPLVGALYCAAPGDFRRAYDMMLNPTADAFEGANTNHRLDLIVQGLPMVLALNPFGVGFDERSIEITQQLSPDVANVFVSYAFYKGVIYVGFFAMFLGYLAWQCMRRRDMTAHLLGWLLLSLIATYLSYSEFFITLPVFLIFFLVHFATKGHSEEQVSPQTERDMISGLEEGAFA